MGDIGYETVSFTDCGKLRQQNEDSYLLRQQSSAHGPVVLAAVADGMGGLSHGKQASQILIQALLEWWEHEFSLLSVVEETQQVPWDSIEKSLEEYIACANQRILHENIKMGTTLSLLLICNRQYLVKHAGDSRIYFARAFGLEQVTRDQTWYEQEKERGTLQQHTVAVEKMQNVLVNAIGVKQEYILDLAKGDLENVEVILLCSDGIYNYISFADLEKILQSRRSVEAKAQKLKKHIQNSEARDNYTAILIQKQKSRCSFANFWRID